MAIKKRLIDAYKLVIDLAKANKQGRLEYDDVLAVIASQKTEEAVEVVHGTWLDWHGKPVLPDEFYRWWRCSECKYQYVFDDAVKREHFPSNYCPNCGAKMDL